MGPVEIYCVGAVTQAIYMAIKMIGAGKDKKAEGKKFFAELDKEAVREGIPFKAKKAVPFIIILMILIWPYVWIDKLLFKKNPK